MTGCADGTARVWSSSGQLLRTLTGHTDRLGRVAMHPDGNLAATASFDRTWRLWDLERGACLYEQEGQSRAVYAVAFQVSRQHQQMLPCPLASSPSLKRCHGRLTSARRSLPGHQVPPTYAETLGPHCAAGPIRCFPVPPRSAMGPWPPRPAWTLPLGCGICGPAAAWWCSRATSSLSWPSISAPTATNSCLDRTTTPRASGTYAGGSASPPWCAAIAARPLTTSATCVVQIHCELAAASQGWRWCGRRVAYYICVHLAFPRSLGTKTCSQPSSSSPATVTTF